MNNKKNIQQLIGEYLIGSEIISPSALEMALDEQQRTGSLLGDVLLSQGKLNNIRFYQALAGNKGLTFVNLYDNPCNRTLLDDSQIDQYAKLQLLPYKKVGDKVLIATTTIGKAQEIWAEEFFPNHEFVITSPLDIIRCLELFFSDEYDYRVREKLAKEQPHHSAKSIPFMRYVIGLAGFFVMMILFSLTIEMVLIIFLVAINLFFLCQSMFKLFLLYNGCNKECQLRQTPNIKELPKDKNVPIYTLLVPLYCENEITVSKLIQSIRAIDYPKSKLDVKLIVEDDDLVTYQHIVDQNCEAYFHIVRVPESYPRTKPKACNYALQFARGEYVTIYDAEDAPDPLQLKKVLQLYAKEGPDVGCVQAKLNFYNAKYNWLTRMFSLEYSGLFHFLLPGLERLSIPIPLGGTSNHFRTKLLKQMIAWDPYNVTEDADLGVRLTKLGYRTLILDSTTLEEAPEELMNWIKQRSRWIKGYMQTYLVHRREMHLCNRQIGIRGQIGFFFFIGMPSLIYLTKPIIFVFILGLWLAGTVIPLWVWFIIAIGLFAGIVVHWLLAMAVVIKLRQWSMIPYSVMHPVYWLLHTIASYKAAWELIYMPHYWEKTQHHTRKTQSAA